MENRQWFNKKLAEVYEELKSGPAGLSQKEARRRSQRGNELLVRKKESLFSLILGVFSDFSPVILVLVAILAVIMEQGEGAGIIIFITAVYLLVSIFINIRSQFIIESMCGQRTPRVQVLRDGKVYYVPSSSVVPGDIVMLSEGDVVPADCRIISSADLFVHEGGVTNNAFSVPKFSASEEGISARNPEEMSNMLFALSKVTHGSARAVVVDVGAATYVVRTRGKNKIPVSGKLKIMSVMSEYSRISGLLVPAVAFVIMVVAIIVPPYESSIYPVFMWGFSLCAASVSYLFQLIGRAAAANALESVSKSDRGGTVVTELTTLERIRNTDTVVFSAESAVLTEECRVCSLYHNNTEHDPYFPDGYGGREMLGMAAATINSLGQKLSLSGEGVRAPFYRAVIDCAIEQGADSSAYPVVESVVKSYDSRFNTALFYVDGEYTACSIGDASEIMPYCRECIIDGKKVPMTTMIFSRAQQIMTTAEANARTVIAVAERKTGYNNLHRLGALQSDLTLVGFIIIEREISSKFEDALEDIVDSNIGVLMFTSEQSNPVTSKKLALTLGVADSEEQILTGAQVAQMSDNALVEKIPSVRAVVCVGGDERVRIVYALERAGKKPAYIGAETCDIAAATAATVSFGCAMTGKRKRMEVLSRDTDKYGSQILKMISDVTIQRAQKKHGGLDAYLNTLLAAESYFNNIRNAVGYLIMMQMFRLVVAVLGVCTGMTVFFAVQILFSGLIVDLFGVIAFSYRRERLIFPKDGKKWRYLHQLKKVLPFALIFGSLTVLIPFIASLFGVFDVNSVSAAVFASVLLSQIALHAHYSCVGCIISPSEWKGGIPSGLMYIGVLLFLFAGIASEPFGLMFGLYTGHAHDILYSFITPLILLVVMEIKKYLTSAKELNAEKE